jgi:hemerythrin-like domain-containing protein
MPSPDFVRPDTSDMPAVHKVFRTALASAPALLESTRTDGERRRLIANYYLNILSFLEAHHHGEELLVFPLIIERAPDQAALIAVANQQHEQVMGLIEMTNVGLQSWAQDNYVLNDMIRQLAALETCLVPHLDQEERDVLPIVTETVSGEEWGQLPGHTMKNFAGDKLWLIIGLIREQFTPAQREMMSNAMPPPVVQMWESSGEGLFDQTINQIRQLA